MRTVACPSHAIVIALSTHVDGSGVCGAAGTSLPSSSNRSRRKRAGHDADMLAHVSPPAPAARPPARNVRRRRSRLALGWEVTEFILPLGPAERRIDPHNPGEDARFGAGDGILGTQLRAL